MASKPTVRGRFTPRVRNGVDFTDSVVRTKQSFKDECDINNIMRKFVRTGVVSHVNRFGARYGFAPALEYRDALHIVAEAQLMFAALPAKVRKRFGGDPEEFLAFVQDPANTDEARELGLIMAPGVDPADELATRISEKIAERETESTGTVDT